MEIERIRLERFCNVWEIRACELTGSEGPLSLATGSHAPCGVPKLCLQTLLQDSGTLKHLLLLYISLKNDAFIFVAVSLQLQVECTCLLQVS